MKKKHILWACLIMLVPFVSGAVVVDDFEGFEDFNHGDTDLSTSSFSFDAQYSVYESATFAYSGSKSGRVLDNEPGASVIMIPSGGFPTSTAVALYPQTSGSGYIVFVLYDSSGDILQTFRIRGTGAITADGFSTTISSNCGAKPYLFTFTDFDFDTDTMDISVKNGGGSTCGSLSNHAFTQNSEDFKSYSIGTQFLGSAAYMDDFSVEYTVFDAPDGLGASVFEVEGGTASVFFEVAVSPDDPDQDSGGFAYEIFGDDGGGASLIGTTSIGAGVDGVIGIEIDITDTGSYSFYATKSGSPPSDDSCSVTVSLEEVNSDDCGAISAASAGGGSIFGDDGLFYGGDKASYAESWKLTESALDMMFGVILVFIFAGIGYQVSGQKTGPAIGGAAGGLLFAFAFGLFSVWVGVFVIASGLGLAALRRRMGGGMADG